MCLSEENHSKMAFLSHKRSKNVIGLALKKKIRSKKTVEGVGGGASRT